MSNLGKYQTIVEEAYKAGGVDAWLKTIKDAAYSQGSADTKNRLLFPVAVGCVAIGALGKQTYDKLAPMVKAKYAQKKQLKKSAEEAEVLLKQELEPQVDAMETLSVSEQ